MISGIPLTPPPFFSPNPLPKKNSITKDTRLFTYTQIYMRGLNLLPSNLQQYLPVV